MQLFQEDFGVPYTEIYESFNEQPIAAASLAQVKYVLIDILVFLFVNSSNIYNKLLINIKICKISNKIY